MKQIKISANDLIVNLIVLYNDGIINYLMYLDNTEYC